MAVAAPLVEEVPVADFKKEFLDKVEELIQIIESKTCVEIVPVLSDRVSEYRLERLCLSLIVWIVYLSVFFLVPTWFAVWEIYTLGFVLFLGLFYATGWGPVFRLVFPKRLVQSVVEKAALNLFVQEELFVTKQRSALLIYVSHFEHAVFVLADKGLSQKLGEGLWKELGTKLASDFCNKNPGQSFIQALTDIGPQLEAAFPIGLQNNPNELENHLRFRLRKKT